MSSSPHLMRRATSWLPGTSCSCARGATSSTATPAIWRSGPRVSAEATRWLWERGVRVMGIDAWGWDAPLYL